MSEQDFVSVGPHKFVALSRWRNKGRCRACLCDEGSHPTRGWTTARAIGDRRSPSLQIRYTTEAAS